jgi:transcriptional regulator with XRE-family HTH domain
MMNIKERRLAMNLTQTELAEIIGTYQEVISKWENGGGVSLQMLCVLAKVFGCKVDDLLGDNR